MTGENGNRNGRDDDEPDLDELVDAIAAQGAMIRVLMNAVTHQRDLIAKIRVEIDELKKRL